MDLQRLNINKIKAMSVHVFTASGLVFGFLGLLATIDGNFVGAVFYLAFALLIDGVDGTLARRYNVKDHTPNIDGIILDNIIDFFTYVIVPSLMIYKFNFIDESFKLPIACLVVLVSCYTFINKNLKTNDYYFTGFPATWNIVVLYFYLLDSSQLANLLAILFLSVLTFIPIKFTHPLRVVYLRKTTIFMVFLWCVTTISMLLSSVESKQVFYLWSVINLYFLLISINRTFLTKNT